MSKKPKKKQTEWNKQGKAIADTYVPLYEANLKRMDKYLANPQKAMDDYLKKYYYNNVEQSDFIRNYNRAMAGLTGQNYNATGGGYDSSNQRMYDDQQRYMNDLAARLRDKGVLSSYDMATGDYRNMLAANPYYQQAWVNGQPYSQTDDYNYQVKQANKWYNQLGGLLGTAGAAIGGVVGGPVGSTIGASLGNTLGDAFTVQMPYGNDSNLYANLGTNAILGYYGQKANIPTQTQSSIRSGDTSSANTNQGQFTNFKDITSNLFDDKLARLNIPSKFSWQK